MRSTRARVLAGILAGAVVGTLGPAFMAVAWHSGNGSGNEPVTAAGAVGEDYVATAAWNLDFDFDPPQGGTPDHFVELVAHRSAGAAAGLEGQALAAEWTGEVIAWRDHVCVWGDCLPAGTWRGVIDPAAGNVFVIDPLVRTARFSGVLVEESTGVSCSFRIGWQVGTGDDSLDGEQDAEVTKLRKLRVDVSGMVTRAAYPEMIDAAECWPTPLGGVWSFGAAGSLMGSSRLMLDAEDATHGCVRVPVRDRICWRDE